MVLVYFMKRILNSDFIKSKAGTLILYINIIIGIFMNTRIKIN